MTMTICPYCQWLTNHQLQNVHVPSVNDITTPPEGAVAGDVHPE